MQAEGQLLTAASYGPIIISYRNGNPVRLNEVAHVYDGVENDKAGDKFMDKPSIDISISKQPGTNVVQVVDDVKALLPTLERAISRGDENLSAVRPLAVDPRFRP